jgi:hypothetical protein
MEKDSFSLMEGKPCQAICNWFGHWREWQIDTILMHREKSRIKSFDISCGHLQINKCKGGGR